MYHSIEEYDDDLPLSAVHLLRVCFVSIDRCLSPACRPQSAADLADHASLAAARFCGRFTPRDGPRTTHQHRELGLEVGLEWSRKRGVMVHGATHWDLPRKIGSGIAQVGIDTPSYMMR